METRAFIFCTWSSQNTMFCSTVVIKMKNEKHLVLFLRTPNAISGKFREFFYFYPWSDPRNRQMRTSEKRGTILLGFSEMWHRGIWQISIKVHEKSTPTVLYYANAERRSLQNICAYVPYPTENTESYPPPFGSHRRMKLKSQKLLTFCVSVCCVI